MHLHKTQLHGIVMRVVLLAALPIGSCGEDLPSLPLSDSALELSQAVPRSAPTNGGSSVKLVGRSFAAQPRVFFGDIESQHVARDSAEELRVRVPPRLGLPGPVAIRVDNGDGSSVVREDLFRYTVTDIQFPAPQATPVPIQPVAMAAADLNGDGALDLAVANSLYPQQGVSGVQLLLGRGDGSFQPGELLVALGITSLLIRDLNRDGRPDLILLCSPVYEKKGRIEVYLGTKTGAFTKAAGADVDHGAYSLAAGLFNADQVPDLALTSGESKRLQIIHGADDGSFTSGPVLMTGNSPGDVVAAHVDSDGYEDLVVANGTDGTLSVFRNKAGTAFLPPALVSVGAPVDSLIAGDLDGDAHADLLAISNGSDAAQLLHGSGTGGFRAGSKLVAARSPRAATLSAEAGQAEELLVGTLLELRRAERGGARHR